jgi:CubicO group peptidase (beta-lactamase class C family)
MHKAPSSWVTIALVFAFINGGVVFTPAQTPSPQNPQPDTEVTKTLSDYFDKVAGLGFSGAVLVSSGDKVLMRNGYGWADQTRRIPVTPESVFDIGSITKVFTAVAIMQLEERGKLTTSDPITKYFSHVPPDKSAITLHQLLTHTSGLEHDDFYASATASVREILKHREKFIQRILSFPLGFEPGTKRSYSNSGFSFLAAIVEKLSGQSYEQYLRENILLPAGMSHTGYLLRKWNNRLVARGYNDGPTDFGYPWTGQWAGKLIAWDLLGNGGLLSTVDDMHRLVVALRNGKLLNEKTRAKMLTVYFADRDQAYGWFISKTEKDAHRFIYHGGDAVPEGWNADLRWFPEDNLIAVVLTNKRIRAGSVRRYAMNDLVDVVLFQKHPQLPEFVMAPASQLRSHSGTYKLPSGALFRVSSTTAAVGGGRTKPILVISGRGQEAIDILFSGNDLPGLSKLSLDLNERTRAYIEALRNNDLVALKKIPAENPEPENALRDWNDFVKANGALTGFEILGTSPMNQTGVQTFVRFEFGKSVVFYHVTWRDQKLHMQDEDTLQPKITTYLRRSFVNEPLNLPFLPQSNVDFATYDPFKGRTIRVSFIDDTLVAHTKGGDIVARRVRDES